MSLFYSRSLWLSTHLECVSGSESFKGVKRPIVLVGVITPEQHVPLGKDIGRKEQVKPLVTSVTT